jgi:hypothetical protein
MRFVKQLDGSAFQSSNCVAATGAMLVDRASGGAIEESGAQVRVQTGDTSGGLGYDQLRWVAGRFWDEVWNFEPSLPWADLVSRARDRGVGLCGSYSVLVGTPHDACRGLFRGNHSVALAEQTADGWIVGDPMADGRYSGCPKGFQEWPDALVRRFAASFVTGISGPVVGAGRAYSIFASADPVPYYPNEPQESDASERDQVQRDCHRSSPSRIGQPRARDGGMGRDREPEQHKR